MTVQRSPSLIRPDWLRRGPGVALRVIVFSLMTVIITLGSGWWWMQWFPPGSYPTAVYPPVFVLSTLALGSGSWCLEQALGAVRRERQRLFRRYLRWAWLCGMLFTSLQGAGINWLFHRVAGGLAAVQAVPFVTMMAVVHVLHFCLAQLFVVYVLVQASLDRYDHEYWWGVWVCTWFWHALGIVWLFALAVMALAVVT
ncbi:MAG: hypothetical protein KatS3mg114_0030 [Planctomycetaceae bacterium]|nr:MAG: hypothetical protein KatS3mg114_0030 [Planctomycetaceae bacterium]